MRSVWLVTGCKRPSILTTTSAPSLPHQAIRYQRPFGVPLIGLLWMSSILGEVRTRYVLPVLLASGSILTELQVPGLERKPPGYEALSEGGAVVGVDQLSMDDYVVKAGYLSGTTYGRHSHIKHDCNLPGNSSLTSEFVVVGHKGRPFALKGDSGAFVLNSYGKLVGLLIAGQEELNTAYVTPMTEVMRDIQQVTGHQVTLP
jgi:hypothetical protein